VHQQMLAFRSSTLLKVARFPWHQPRIMIAHKIKQKDKKDAKQIPPPRIIAVTTSYICKPRSQFQCRIITQNSPLHQVWVLGEPPPLPEAVLEPPVANDTRVHLLRDFVLLPLELPAHLLPQNHEDSVQRGHNPNQIETRTQQAGGRAGNVY
jgi:hypothetical protein